MNIQTTYLMSLVAISELILQTLAVPLAVRIILITLMVILIESISCIKQRYERFKIFDKGNLPSLGKRNIFSGNLYHVFVNNNFCILFENYHKQLGKSFGFFYGPDPWLATTDLDLVHRVFVADSNKHVNTPDFRLPSIPLIVESTLQLKDDKWRKTRRALNATFSHKQIRSDNVVSDIERTCTSWLDRLASQPVEDGSATRGRIVDVLHNFKAYSIDIITKRTLDRQDEGFGDSPHQRRATGDKGELAAAMQANLKCLMSPLLEVGVVFDWAQPPIGYLSKFTKFGRTSKYVSSIFEESLKSRQEYIFENMRRGGKSDEQITGGGDSVLIDALLGLAANEKTKDIDLKAQLWFFFMAGYETTSNTLAILFWFLAKHQAVQEKLRQSVILEGEEAPYLHWSINETLRLYPAAPMAGRTLGEDVQTEAGAKLFSGTVIMANTYSIHRSKDYWGPDVDVFRPERFGEPLGHKDQFFSFGGGPRGCLGKHLAYMEMKAIVARILLIYRIEPCPSTPKEIVWTAPNIIHMILEGPINLKFVELD